MLGNREAVNALKVSEVPLICPIDVGRCCQESR